MRAAGVMLVAVTMVAACGQTPEVEVTDRDGPASPPDTSAALAWEHLEQVEGLLPDRAAAAVVEEPGELTAAWERHAFPGEPPSIDFDDHVVLLLGQADDACPDELTRLEVVDGDLEVAWLPPPGACNQPLIMRVHAVRVHRGVLGDGFSYALQDPFDDQLTPTTVDLPAFEGTAPPAPEPPGAMTDADLDAVFADHPVARCGPEHEITAGDGGADAARTGPVADIGEANDALTDAGFELGRDVIPFVDRNNGGRLGYYVGESDAATIEQTLTDTFGDRAPGVTVSPWAPPEVADAQDALMPLMGGERRPGAIMESTGGPGPVRIGMVDPTREALDAVADAVDPTLVCVDPLLSGVPG